MDPELVRGCFECLKKEISRFYGENSKADAECLINMMPILRQCARMEYALDGDIAKIVMMDNEDRKIAKLEGDKILEDFVNNVSTFGASPAMARYAEKERERKCLSMKWVVAKGRVEAAENLIEELKAEERVARRNLERDGK